MLPVRTSLPTQLLAPTRPWLGGRLRGLAAVAAPPDKPTKETESENEDDRPVSLPHFADPQHDGPTWDNPMHHTVYDLRVIRELSQPRHTPRDMPDRIAKGAVYLLRRGFDVVSRYHGPGGGMTEQAWLNRCLFLETVAGVPGMVGGMTRHLNSLRRMRRDYGWIHTLLEEAENERMHLLIFMSLKQPGPLMRAMVLGAQGVFFNLFFVSYLISPRTCHRFVGYLEEEAIKTYTGLLHDIRENALLGEWQTKTAPAIARKYYKLPDTATLEHIVLCIRADEANHRDVNHTFAELRPDQDVNPFIRRNKAKQMQSPEHVREPKQTK
jgi:hypothetical protein